ncbi:MAG: efflux RND transporter periplasmic adaptor subunit [Candidatus Calescibacterium sp.]|nr:efflux RND transporter periplasmic adaptor subunit [Candidatus Calescibacterium sp.]MDW8088056.1 efflux RND transporter periplasmic adaptor subunit [Candidatus Calescibacterium sp.]
MRKYLSGKCLLFLITFSVLILLASHSVIQSCSEKALSEAQFSQVMNKETKKNEYFCPMHPEVISPKPVRCPKCGMNLTKEKKQYICPMHPDIVSEEFGRCPKCGMNLVPKESSKKHHSHTGHQEDAEHQDTAEIGGAEHKPEQNIKEFKDIQTKQTSQSQKYICPMHPSYVSDKPGSCPICGMNLVPFGQNTEESDQAGIQVSTYKEQLIGVSYGKVSFHDFRKEIRAVLEIRYDETKVYSITPKFSGWIEKLWANFEGKFIKKGDPLFDIYSLDIESALEELRILQRNDFLSSAKEKMLLFGFSEAEIQKLISEPRKKRIVTFRSPYQGFVISKDVFEGQFIERGKEIFRIADLSRVWGVAKIPQSDLPYIKKGLTVFLNIRGYGQLSGKVSYIYPYSRERSFVFDVRVELINRDFKLKPGLYGISQIYVPIGKKLAVPKDSVIFSGEKNYVLVRQNGRILPKEIKIGVQDEKYVEVIGGVAEGEEVVLSANFLIDSESRLQEAFRSFGSEIPDEKKDAQIKDKSHRQIQTKESPKTHIHQH